MEDIKRILVVSRMTEFCRKAILYGISLAQKYNAELCIIHVLYNPFEHMNMPMISLGEEHKKERESIKKELDVIIAGEIKKGLRIKKRIEEGDPEELILKVIKEENCDLAVLHDHKDSFWEHFLYAYRSDELIRKIPCSVLLVKER